MEAQVNVSPKVYWRASFNALGYFEIAYSNGESFLSTLGKKDGKFGTMLKILKQGGTRYANYLESMVKPLEEAGFLSCNHAGGYCKVTDEGIKAFERFNTATNRLDTILGSILGGTDNLGMKAFDKTYVILKSLNHLEDFIYSHGPFKPTGYPFVEAFARAKGEPRNFMLQIASLYHPFAFLLTAGHIISYEERYKTYAFDCDSIISLTEEEIKERLSSKDRYLTGKKIKEVLREYMKKYNIPELKSPLQAFSTLGLIENLKNKKSCKCGAIIEYKDNRYRLTEYGENLAKYIALHILLS